MRKKLIKPVKEAIFWCQFIFSCMVLFSLSNLAISKIEEAYAEENLKLATIELGRTRENIREIPQKEEAAETYSNVVEVELAKRKEAPVKKHIFHKKQVKVEETLSAILPPPPIVEYKPVITIKPHK